jgi:hypothetical protein
MYDEKVTSGDSEEEGHDLMDVIPVEVASRQELIPFLDDRLPAALTETGGVFVSLPAMCRSMGLAYNGQMRRIRDTPVLFRGLRRIPLQTGGGVQQTNCLRVDKVALWLVGVEPGRMKRDTARSAALRSKIEQYQEELAPLATQVFLQVMGIQTTQLVPRQDEQLVVIARQLDQLSDIVSIIPVLQEHLVELMHASGQHSLQLDLLVELLEETLGRQAETEAKLAKVDERTVRLTPRHAAEVKRKAEQIAGLMLKKMPDMKSGLAYSWVYGRLKKRYHTTSYVEIADELFEDVMAYLDAEAQKLGDEGPSQGTLL